MEIKSITAFINYYQRTRATTNAVIATIPPEGVDWTYAPGKFSIGDLIRHIAAIERNVFMQIIQGLQPCYRGCGKEFANGYPDVLRYFEAMHHQSLGILHAQRDGDLLKGVQTVDGKQTSMANFLRALIVHEVHHRGALCIYLNLLGVTTPPVIGLTSEQVIQFSETKEPSK